MAELTPFQTVGPYWSIGLCVGLHQDVADNAIVIRGRLIDGAGQPIPDGVLEWWHPSLATLLRATTEDEGRFAVHTIKPRAAAGQGAPHLAVRVLARGILTQYVTRVYFEDEPATAEDPVLKLIPDARRHTLIAARESASEYRFDVIVQGDHETVFFDV